MDKIKNVIISYWYKELTFNPKKKLNDLEKELSGIFDLPFMYNQDETMNFISMPRIQAMTKDKKYLFQMSLINATLTIDVNELENDEIILLINKYAQLFMDTLINIYKVEVCYTSIKLEMIEEISEPIKIFREKYNLGDSLEDFSIKKGFIKDDYYINYLVNSGKEYNFNVKRGEKDTEKDLFDRTLITSISEASLNKEFIMKMIEINDRLAFNKNKEYISSDESIRGMIIELKNILENKLYEK